MTDHPWERSTERSDVGLDAGPDGASTPAMRAHGSHARHLDAVFHHRVVAGIEVAAAEVALAATALLGEGGAAAGDPTQSLPVEVKNVLLVDEVPVEVAALCHAELTRADLLAFVQKDAMTSAKRPAAVYANAGSRLTTPEEPAFDGAVKGLNRCHYVSRLPELSRPRQSRMSPVSFRLQLSAERLTNLL
jgi:hypothetical protein